MSRPRSASLVRRVMLTLTLAVIASFAAVSAYIVNRDLSEGTGEMDRANLYTARAVAASLADVTDEREARQLVAAIDRLSDHQRLHHGDPVVRIAVYRNGGPVVFSPTDVPDFDHAALVPGINDQSIDGRKLLLFAHDAGPWRVVLIDDLRERKRFFLRELFPELGEYLLITLPILLLPVWLAVRAGLAPLRRLSDDVAARQPGDLTTRLPPSSYEELAPLVLALNDLLQRLSHSLAREKAFVADAAHEMRTPLAVISTQAHLLAGADAETRTHAHRRFDDAMQRVSHLTHQLLRLAQMDTRDRSMRQVVDVMVVVRESVADVVSRTALPSGTHNTGADVSLNGPDVCVLQTDAHAIQSILENLLDNALRYAGRAAVIEVAIEATMQSLSIQVADDGPGIAEAERDAVFERFRRGASATSPGAGLGLAIVAQAAQSLGGHVELAQGLSGRGCRFTVRLPVNGAGAPTKSVALRESASAQRIDGLDAT